MNLIPNRSFDELRFIRGRVKNYVYFRLFNIFNINNNDKKQIIFLPCLPAFQRTWSINQQACIFLPRRMFLVLQPFMYCFFHIL